MLIGQKLTSDLRVVRTFRMLTWSSPDRIDKNTKQNTSSIYFCSRFIFTETRVEVTLVERAVYILDMNVERRSGSKLRLCYCIVLDGAAPSPTDRTSRVE